jgi:hypothetical protein
VGLNRKQLGDRNRTDSTDIARSGRSCLGLYADALNRSDSRVLCVGPVLPACHVHAATQCNLESMA